MFVCGILLLLVLIAAAVVLPAPWSWAIGLLWIAYDTWLVSHHIRRGRLAVARSAADASGPRLRVGVLIAAHNEAATICACVARIGAAPDDQVLVLDDGSDDGTATAVMEQYGLTWQADLESDLRCASRPGCPICVLRLPRGGKARALNRGLALATGDVILTVDADTALEPGALDALRQAFSADPGLSAACGILTPVCQRGLLATAMCAFQQREYARAFLWRAGWAADGMLVLVSGAFAAYRRSALEAVGGFDPDSLVEDYEVMYRLHARQPGTRAQVVPGARASTDAPAAVLAFLHQRARWFGGFLATLWRYRQLVGDPRHGALGCWHLRLKTVDMLLPVYGLVALAVLIATWGIDGRPHVLVLGVLGGKLLADAVLHAWAGRIYRRWLGLPALGWWELPVGLAEQICFQPVRQFGALCGWWVFAGRSARGGMW